MSAPTKPRKTRTKAAPKPGPELTDDELAALTEEPANAGPIGEDGEIRPVVIGKRGRKGDAKVEMTTIFELDGKPYQVPKNPSPALVLKFMRDLRKGRAYAVESMAFTLLGDEALEALAASPEVEPEDVADVFTIIGTIFFGSPAFKSLQEASGN